jgi:hypothetical protein
MADQVFTYANNYNGFATGDVNERTGSFDFSIHLLKINANKLKGPELEINTSIDTFNQQDHGFGPGLKLSLSKIDLTNQPTPCPHLQVHYLLLCYGLRY